MTTKIINNWLKPLAIGFIMFLFSTGFSTITENISLKKDMIHLTNSVNEMKRDHRSDRIESINRDHRITKIETIIENLPL